MDTQKSKSAAATRVQLANKWNSSQIALPRWTLNIRQDLSGDGAIGVLLFHKLSENRGEIRMVNYSPILRWKQGERSALSNLSPAGRANVIPLIVVSQLSYGDTKPPKAPPKTPPKNAPLSAPDAFVKQVRDAWGNGKIFIDVSDLPGTPAFHHLDNIRASANAAGLTLVPSVKYLAPPAYHSAVTRMIAADNRGAALRVTLNEMTNLANLVGNWYCPIAQTDLIVDLGGSVGTALALGAATRTVFQNLHQAQAWRSVTVAGGNIPATLTGYLVGQTMLARAELDLWQALVAHPVGYVLHFGDYATVGPDASTDNIPGPVPINAKYTPHGQFQIFHGVKTKGPGSVPRDVQYRSYAASIVALPQRVPLPVCWGDQTIDAIAGVPGTSAGSPATWVAYGINRHIELTRSQLP
ncbi:MULTISPECIES: beta family protein [unclassified Mesorhizobium]|uniref:beta family protein n=1 Tax=unclassified Mesorhizobium TaxID=325217 RepID=UPI0013E001E2|nr:MULTISPECIES: hypothetical protein [unclassified Mesorhizobium]